ncbi:16S rRNA (adenine(1518)-N(6)/adenine(1519)-N(6))-dimethyltransferase RsmA [Actinomyces minihominis]|uniref:16S rRNA (adenine(1518)-N(6)/adenine(1519)-N(6))- dimethyltransferase RsmA n=1 Tax=Actinomyces minihominis TaxID=2002838 RepID=UPI000C06BF8D|nr:16S rRNA (adenine(1518)-N(6)/adenine(1519)-N(6))-dimethyltransferase RsmA [Actinomyces minihominis]
MADQPSSSRLLGPVEIRELAAQHGVTPTKKLGQNFVHDAGTVRRIVSRSGVQPGESVLEVGPGLGSLTLGLLEAGVRVVAVELDGALAEALPGTVLRKDPEWAGRLSVINRDATELQVEELPELPSALVANLPYNVAVPILLTLLRDLPTLRSALVMVQKEVADRLVAKRGSKTYGAPTVKLAWYGRSEHAGTIGPDVFWPRPNIDSGLVRFTAFEVPRGSEELRAATFRLIDAAFEQRRKMIRSSLKPVISNPDDMTAILAQAEVDPQARPESLGVEQFLSIAKVWLNR